MAFVLSGKSPLTFLSSSSITLFQMLNSLTEYLRHAECYHTYTNDYNKCNLDYHDNERKREQSNATSLLHLQLWCWYVSLVITLKTY